LHEAIEQVEQARQILIDLKLPQDEAGQTLAQYDGFLVQLKAEQDGA
jgi:hypothetical protein